MSLAAMQSIFSPGNYAKPNNLILACFKAFGTSPVLIFAAGSKKKGRTTFTEHQVGEMEKKFAETNYITNEMRHILSDKLGLQQHQVRS